MSKRKSAKPKPTVDELLAQFSPEVRELALAARELVRSVVPDAVEAVNLGWKNIWFGTGMRDAIFVINPVAQRVNLNIADAVSLNDPDRLLEGTGKGIRHVKSHSLETLKRPELRRLLDRAAERSRPGAAERI